MHNVKHFNKNIKINNKNLRYPKGKKKSPKVFPSSFSNMEGKEKREKWGEIFSFHSAYFQISFTDKKPNDNIVVDEINGRIKSKSSSTNNDKSR